MNEPVPNSNTSVTRSRSWLRNLKLRTKLSQITMIYVGIIMLLLPVIMFSLDVATGVRAYVGGEGMWSKGQKDAVFYLLRYARTHDPKDFAGYRAGIAHPLGDRMARIELLKPEYDLAVVQRGFLEGGNALEDIPHLISLFRRFGEVVYLKKAIEIWTEADFYIEKLEACANELHAAIQAGAMTPELEMQIIERITEINAKVTPLEHAFSTTLAKAVRLAQAAILVLILMSAAILLLGGVWLTWWISRDLHAQILALRDGALRVAGGDLDHPIEVHSNDELGDLANVFNNMVQQVKRANAELAARGEQLERSNQELEQFAYIASHDLQSPLRSISGFSQLLTRRYSDKLDDEAREFLTHIAQGTAHMQALIRDLLAFSTIGRKEGSFAPVDCEAVLSGVVMQLKGMIDERNAQIANDPLPTVIGSPREIHQLLQNLIANAIKFQPGDYPRVFISAVRDGEFWKLGVRDYGIGIAPEYQQGIFKMFKRLHASDEYEGTGIGLSICQKIVQGHGGQIWVESETGHGATFYFTLKAA